MKIKEVYGLPSHRNHCIVVQGHPGSGKSTFTRMIRDSNLVYNKYFGVHGINDYALLNYWYQQEQALLQQRQGLDKLKLYPHIGIAGYPPQHIFEPNSAGGFDIQDLKIFDKALEIMAHSVMSSLLTSPFTNVGGKLVGLPQTLYMMDFARPFNTFAQNVAGIFGSLREFLTIVIIDAPPEVTNSNILARQNKETGDSHNPGSPSIIQSIYYDNYIPGEELCKLLATAGFSCILVTKTGLAEIADYTATAEEIAAILF